MSELTLEQRLKRLEEGYERLYHTNELLTIYIPKLTAILIKYFKTSENLRYDIFGDFKSLQSVLTNILDDLQVHYKEHFDEIKRRVDASKRKPIDTNKLNNIYKDTEGGNGKP